MEVENLPEAARVAQRIPAAVRWVADRLLAGGHQAFFVGGCVRDLLGVRRPSDFDLATSAAPAAVLALFPRAVPIGLRHGTVMVPTSDAPVDVTTFQRGPDIHTDLAHRDFTIGAMALDARSGELLDPHGGREDLAHHRLRAVGGAAARFAEDPLRALRAARLVACLDLMPDAEIEPAMAGSRSALGRVAAERLQHELTGTLLAPDVERGLGMLRRSGIEADLAPGVRDDAHAVVTALDADLDLRLAGWLRGTAARRILSRLRFGRRTCEHVGRLVDLHPIDSGAGVGSDAALRRLLRRAGEADLAPLLALREAELRVGATGEDAGEARAGFEKLREALERLLARGRVVLHRRDLALDGQAVMVALGCAPGPRIGQALDYLSERVLDDPSLNTPDQLRGLLAGWRGSAAPEDA